MLFRVLGPLSVEHDGAALSIPGARLRLLLAALLVEANREVSMDRLIDVVWAGTPPPSATSSLHNQVLRLRRLLPERDSARLRTTASGYLLAVAEDELDLRAFLDGCREGRAAHQRGDWARARTLLGAATALWRGEPLSDLPERPVLRHAVANWTEQWLHALECRIEADIELGGHTEVIAELAALRTAHPLRERFHLLAMLANDRAGRRADALAVYRDAREVLVEELGIEPGRELRQLHQQVLAADTAEPVEAPEPAPRVEPRRPSVAQLPADLSDFTGRQQQVKHLADLLTGLHEEIGPRPVVVAAITGIGGVGKTTLAVRVAHLVAEDFPDGQLHVDLHGADDAPRPPAEVLADFLRDLAGPDTVVPAGLEARAARFRSLLAGRRVLVLLDNARDAAQVRPLLPGSGGCAVVVTSRNRLPGLAGAALVDLDVLPDPEARALFAAIVGPARVHAEPEATLAVLACCAGLPLAIRIAAGRLAGRPSWTIAWLANRLTDQRRVLDELRVEDVEVRTSFLLSYANLADRQAAQAFRSIGLFAESELSLDAAAALIGLPPHRAEDVLESLVDANLIEAPLPGRYHIHDLLRLYANEMAMAEDDLDTRTAAAGRLALWCLGAMRAADRVLVPQFHFRRPAIPDLDPDHPAPTFADYSAALAWCEQQRETLIVATRLAADHGLHELAWLIPAYAQGYYSLRARWPDWLVSNDIALRSARLLGDRAAQGYLLNARAEALGRTHQFAEAGVCLAEALTIRRELGDVLGEFAVHIGLGTTAAEQGRVAEASEHARRALDLARSAGNRTAESFALNSLGEYANKLDQPEQALRYQRECQLICREVGDVAGEGRAGLHIAEVHLAQGEIDAALHVLDEAVPLIKAGRNRYYEARASTALGTALARAGRLVEARAQLVAAVEMWSELDEVRTEQVRALLATLD